MPRHLNVILTLTLAVFIVFALGGQMVSAENNSENTEMIKIPNEITEEQYEALLGINLSNPFKVEVTAEKDGDLFEGEKSLNVELIHNHGDFEEAPTTFLIRSTTVDFIEGIGSFTIGEADTEEADVTLTILEEDGYQAFADINDVENIEVSNDDLEITKMKVEGVTDAVYETVHDAVYTEVKVQPETINLRAQGRWINAKMDLPNIDVQETDFEAVKFAYNGEEVAADWGRVLNGALKVKFDRREVAGILEDAAGETVEVSVIAEVNGEVFKGDDEIRVISPAANGPGKDNGPPFEEHPGLGRGPNK